MSQGIPADTTHAGPPEHELVTTLFDLGRQVTAVLDLDAQRAVDQRRPPGSRRFADIADQPIESNHILPHDIELKLFTAQSDLVSETVGAVRFFPDGGSTGGRVTLAAGERKFDVDIDWLTGRVAIAE
mgnify:CR=1 FL=1